MHFLVNKSPPTQCFTHRWEVKTQVSVASSSSQEERHFLVPPKRNDIGFERTDPFHLSPQLGT